MPPSQLTASSQATLNSTKPLATTNIFVNDHIVLAQGMLLQLQSIHQNLLLAIDMVFQPLEISDHPTCQEPVLLKKLAKGMVSGPHNRSSWAGTWTQWP